jgi:hypothetical protein
MSGKTSSTLHGTVARGIKSPIPNVPEKAQTAVEEGDHLFREIRIDNTLKNENGRCKPQNWCACGSRPSK